MKEYPIFYLKWSAADIPIIRMEQKIEIKKLGSVSDVRK